MLQYAKLGMLELYSNFLDKFSDLNKFQDLNATYEQAKKGLSYFYPKRQVQDDGIHTKPLNLQELKLITCDAMYLTSVAVCYWCIIIIVKIKYEAVNYILSS